MAKETILLPVDLSETAPRVAEYALALSRILDAEIHVIHAFQPILFSQVSYSPGPPELKIYNTELDQLNLSRMEKFVQEHLRGAGKVHSVIVRGEVREEILTYIKANEITLVAMATRGKKGLERVVFGSVAQSMVQSSPVPVMTYNQAEGNGQGPIAFRKILLPIDLTATASAAVVRQAARLGRASGAEMHLIHVIRSTPRTYPGDEIYIDQLNDYRQQLQISVMTHLNRFAEKHLQDYGEVKKIVRIGHTARRILKYVEQEGIDLVVMGTHGRRGLGRVLFGSVAQRVVQHSPVPVITMNPYD